MAIVQLSFVFLALAASTVSFAAAGERWQRSIIGTHDARFHCDEVTACFLLKQLDRFKGHSIMRTRDPAKLALAEIVVDVGGQLDERALRFDHHQRTFNQTIHDYHPRLKTTNPSSPPRLSSAGLVYAIFGKDIIAKVLKGRSSYRELNNEDRGAVNSVYGSVYRAFIEEVDAIDNGIESVPGENVVYNYRVKTGIGSRVSRLNPGPGASMEMAMKRFEQAMKLVGDELIETIRFYGGQPRGPGVGQGLKEFIMKREEFDPSGQIVLMDEAGMTQWRTAIFNLESELGIEGEIKYLVYKEGTSPNYRVVAVPAGPGSFKSRVPLKEEWRGLSDRELQKVSGVRDATFVHASGFTGGARSLEGVKQMCLKSLRPAAAAGA